MALRDFGRGGRARERNREEDMRLRDESRDFGRPNYVGDEQGFNRRGWREGSDYYGNDPERYANRGYGAMRWQGDDIAGHEPYRSVDEDALQREQHETRWWNERSGWPRGDPSTDWADFRGRGPRGYQRSAERIREDACERLTDDDRIDATDVDVAVKDGEVTLTGTVGSREQKHRAEDVIEGVAGVKDIHNVLRVASSGEPFQSSTTRDEGNRGQASTRTTPPEHERRSSLKSRP